MTDFAGLEMLDREDLIAMVKRMVNGGVSLSFHGKRTAIEIARKMRPRVTRQNLNNVLNGKSGISPEMANRISKAFGSRAEVWLGLQMEYHLAGGK